MSMLLPTIKGLQKKTTIFTKWKAENLGYKQIFMFHNKYLQMKTPLENTSVKLSKEFLKNNEYKIKNIT